MVSSLINLSTTYSSSWTGLLIYRGNFPQIYISPIVVVAVLRQWSKKLKVSCLPFLSTRKRQWMNECFVCVSSSHENCMRFLRLRKSFSFGFGSFRKSSHLRKFHRDIWNFCDVFCWFFSQKSLSLYCKIEEISVVLLSRIVSVSIFSWVN